jgi:L-alanine-DL-glutamate epimerase-like enolase superfamily enzyme
MIKIERISFILCQYPLSVPIPLSCGALTHRNFGLIRIETNKGIDGWGETSINFPPWSYHERRATIEDGLGTLLVGENPLEIGRLWHKLVNATRSFTRMWSEGALLQAIGGIDIALWDIAGKEYGVPVCQLLGGRFRDEAVVYATGVRTDDLSAGLRDVATKGYRVVKIRVGFDDDRDEANVRLMREAIGHEIGLMVDANQAWTYPRARKMMRRLMPYSLYWMEEPVLSDDLDGYLHLRAEFPNMPLAWGENAFSISDYQSFLAAKAVDFVMPDPSRSGGLTQCVRLCEMASRFGIPFSPHHYGSDLGFAAVLQLLASQADFLIMLRDVSNCPLREEILAEPFEVRRGKVAIPLGPGLGVSINWKAVEKYQVKL